MFGMPADLVLASAAVGVVFALFRIVWLIVAAVFLYDIAVATGQFDVMKASIARLSGDRRLQAVLVAFSFGAFIEGAAGFGAPVAISAAFLVGLGFEPFQAAVLCLIANTAPVAWGAIGTPIRTLATVTGLDVEALSATSGRILPFLSLVIPFWLVRTMVGWRETLAVWPALVVVGGSFAAAQFLWSNFVGFELVDIVSAVASLVAGVVLLRFWRPEVEWRFPHDEDAAEAPIDPWAEDAGRRGADRRAGGPGLDALRPALGDGAGLGHPAGQGVDGRRTRRGGRRWPACIEAIAKGEAVTGHAAARAGRLGEGPDRHRPGLLDRHGGLPGGGRQRPLAGRPAASLARLLPGRSRGWCRRSPPSSACWRWGS